MGKVNNPIDDDFFSKVSVKKCKDEQLKLRLKTLIHNKGMSESDFYNKIMISRQYWYFISWGIWEPTLDLKIKISKELETDSALIWQNDT